MKFVRSWASIERVEWAGRRDLGMGGRSGLGWSSPVPVRRLPANEGISRCKTDPAWMPRSPRRRSADEGRPRTPGPGSRGRLDPPARRRREAGSDPGRGGPGGGDGIGGRARSRRDRPGLARPPQGPEAASRRLRGPARSGRLGRGPRPGPERRDASDHPGDDGVPALDRRPPRPAPQGDRRPRPRHRPPAGRAGGRLGGSGRSPGGSCSPSRWRTPSPLAGSTAGRPWSGWSRSRRRGSSKSRSWPRPRS